jgi:hypothetical protein
MDNIAHRFTLHATKATGSWLFTWWGYFDILLGLLGGYAPTASLQPRVISIASEKKSLRQRHILALAFLRHSVLDFE